MSTTVPQESSASPGVHETGSEKPAAPVSTGGQTGTAGAPGGGTRKVGEKIKGAFHAVHGALLYFYQQIVTIFTILYSGVSEIVRGTLLTPFNKAEGEQIVQKGREETEKGVASLQSKTKSGTKPTVTDESEPAHSEPDKGGQETTVQHTLEREETPHGDTSPSQTHPALPEKGPMPVQSRDGHPSKSGPSPYDASNPHAQTEG